MGIRWIKMTQEKHMKNVDERHKSNTLHVHRIQLSILYTLYNILSFYMNKEQANIDDFKQAHTHIYIKCEQLQFLNSHGIQKFSFEHMSRAKVGKKKSENFNTNV